MKRLSIAVIFGGRSVEHDVSIVTAHQVIAALSERHDVVPVYITREGKWLSAPALNDLDVYRQRRWNDAGEEAFIPPIAGYGGLMVAGGRLRGPRRVAVDVVVPAIHGTYGEDGTLQGLLELADLPYTCSGLTGSTVGMDKVAMKACFAAAGLPLVPHVLVDSARLKEDPIGVANEAEATIGYPAFVKPARLGSSVGIGKATDRGELLAALEVAQTYDRRILVEKAMEGCIEVNASVLGGYGIGPRVSVCEQPLSAAEYLSFQDKYMSGGKGGAGGPKGAGSDDAETTGGMASQDRRIPAPISDALTKRVQENALAAFAAVDAAGVARIDSFAGQETGETWVMEINTVPGSFSFYLWEASGLAFPDLMEELLRIALAGAGAKRDLMFTFESGMLEAQGGSKQRG